ncbi:MAG: hypothetical protein Q9209_003956 [Squamulea sp. 1 TL-2023]
MAPRRGGGGGGGSGASGLSENNPFGFYAELPATGFADPYDRARLVFQAIGLLGIIGVMIWARTFRKYHELNKVLFKWWAFWLTALALFVSFAIYFIVTIIYEAASEVQVIFFLIVTIISESGPLAEISLLGVIYLMLPHCSSHPNRHGERPRIAKALKIGHGIFLFILSALWISSMALRIQYQVEYVLSDLWTARLSRRSREQLSGSYHILYFLGTLEILAWSILGFVKKRTEHSRVSYSCPTARFVILNLTKVQVFMLALIAGPLLLRSTYIMGDSIYEDLRSKRGNNRLYLATDIIYNLTSVVIYAGIVAIGRHFATSNQLSNGLNQSYNHNYWGQNGHGFPPQNPTKPNMAVHEGASPPFYQQGNFQPAPYGHQGHGYPQYTMPPPQHQPYLNQQYAQQQPNQPQYQQQQPYQFQGYYPLPQQQQIRSPQSPPPQQQQQQMSPVMQTSPQHQVRSPQSPPPQQQQQQQQQVSPVMQTPSQHGGAPSEVSGVTNSSELPSSTNTHGPHAQ